MIPFLDLGSDFAEVATGARSRIDAVFARQQFVLGPETAELEGALRIRLGVSHTVAVSSGSDALSLALLALGIGAGDAVILPAFTFFATAGAVARAGAVPVFCDVDPRTLLADARRMRAVVERDFDAGGSSLRHRASGARLAAVMPVHLYGRCSDMRGIVDLAGQLGVRVVEDAAQALGARAGATVAGGFGDVGCYSFYPTKNLGAPGDGGLLATNDAAIGERLASLRVHGATPGSYVHNEVGVNARMSELVAAVLNAKLARFDAWTARRRALADVYDGALAEAEAAGLLVRPPLGNSECSVWHQYTVRLARGAARDEVQRRLTGRGVQVRVFYPLPLHLQPCFSSLGYKAGDLPESEAASGDVLSLPIYPSLANDDAARVAEELVAAIREVSG